MDSATREMIQNFDIPNPFKPRVVVDFVLCNGLEELKETIHKLNVSSQAFLSATQEGEVYTVFFRRSAG